MTRYACSHAQRMRMQLHFKQYLLQKKVLAILHEGGVRTLKTAESDVRPKKPSLQSHVDNKMISRSHRDELPSNKCDATEPTRNPQTDDRL